MTEAERFQDARVRKKPWRFRELLITYVVLLLLSGVHFGLIVFAEAFELNAALASLIPMLYWAVMAAAFTVITNRQIRRQYDEPMRALGNAAREVSSGDFSIYLKPRHTEDQMDYIDVAFLDFNKMVEELGSIETMKTDFFSNVSHEMKAPLAVILSSLELIKSGKLTEEEADRQLDTAASAARRMGALIENLLKLNKLEKQTIVPKQEPYDVCEQLCDCILEFEPVWEEKELEIEAELEDSALITADEGLMRLVWNNLLSNAVKFTEPGGSVTVRQRTEGDRIVIAVSDTGCGMSEETARRIFEKFYQGDTSHATEGNGLGLALVLRILQLMNGSITVQSREGEGSVFTVSLPVGTGQEEN